MEKLYFFLLILIIQLFLLQKCLGQEEEDESTENPDTSDPPEEDVTVTESPDEEETIPTLPPIPDYGAVIKETQERIEKLEAFLQTMQTTILERITNLETSHYNVLSERVTAVESGVEELKGQMSQITTNVDDKLAGIEIKLTDEVRIIGEALNTTRIEVGDALTSLEMGKVQKLINQDEVWRKNFRKLNVTINKLGKRAFKG